MSISKKFYIAAASLVVAVGALVALNISGTSTQAVSSFRNCNADAIINCGAISQSELLEKYDENVGDVKSVYSHYGISRTDIAGTNGEVKVGTVYQDGRVVVNGETVATGAYSVSRVRYTSAGAPTNVTINGTTYYEGPSMQIFTGSVDAFVIFRDGQFYKAVLSSCGNPLIAVPTPPIHKPVYACNSLTATMLDRTRYRFTASATAQDGAEIVGYVFTFGDGESKTSSSYTIEHTYDQPGSYDVRVSVKVNVDGKIRLETSEDCTTTIDVEEKPEVPAYTCDSLTADKISRTESQFTAAATAENGAEIVSYTYNFGDGQSITSENTQVNHTYAAAGIYNATLTANFKVDGKTKTATDPNCKVTVEVKEQPVTPIYRCDSLTAQLIQSKDRTYQYGLVYTAEGGATLDHVTYNFGDSTSETFAAADATSVQHTFATAGTYTTTATLYFSIGQNSKTIEKSDSCQVSVTMAKPQYCPLPGKENLPANSPDCVDTPQELPKTGLDMFIGGGLGLGSISAAGYYWSVSRKNLLNTFLKR